MSKRINLVVTKCSECPYLYDAWECSYNSKRMEPLRETGDIPDWCPLPDDTETPNEQRP